MQLVGYFFLIDLTTKLALKAPKLISLRSFDMDQQQIYRGHVVMLDGWDVHSYTVIHSLQIIWIQVNFMIGAHSWPLQCKYDKVKSETNCASNKERVYGLVCPNRSIATQKGRNIPNDWTHLSSNVLLVVFRDTST